jgi:tetratricopeptide (TPR) repeat protein
MNMPVSNNSRASRALAWFRLTYTELQYWLVGLTPEGYHWAQAAAWEDLGNFHRAAKHLSGYLQCSENAQARALLAYCYTRIGSWSLAAAEYTTVLASWPHPSIMLGLAEAKLQLGDLAKARELAEIVERDRPNMEPYVLQALEYLKGNLDAASNKTLERTHGKYSASIPLQRITDPSNNSPERTLEE